MSIILLIIDKESCFTILAQLTIIFVHLVRLFDSKVSLNVSSFTNVITFVSIAIKAELGRVNQLPSDIAD